MSRTVFMGEDGCYTDIDEATPMEDSYMNTCEMWTKAQVDGKVYVAVDGDVVYSKDYGLVFKDNFDKPWSISAWAAWGKWGLDKLLNTKWKEFQTMTKAEAEKKFGIKIIG